MLARLSLLVAAGGLASVSAAQAGPVQKIIALLGDMQTKSIKEGTEQQANFEKMQKWCETQSGDKSRAITEEKKQITAARAQIETSDSNTAQLTAEVEKLSAKISENEKELAEATALRKSQKNEFEKKDAMLVSTIDTLTRAAKVLRKHMKGGGSNAFLQAQSKASQHLLVVRDALSAVVRASFISLEDKTLINNLLQEDKASKDGSKDDDASFLSLASASAQPQASTSNYDSKSGGIVDTFENLKEKAEATRSAGQKDEMKANAGFMLLAQSTRDEIKALKLEMEDAKKKMSRAEETKATAQGNLANVSKDLKADQKYLEDTQRECMNAAVEFENAQKARAEELKVLAKAKEILSSAAFVQMSAQAQAASTGAADASAAADNSAEDDSMASEMGLNSFLQVRLSASVSASVKHSLLAEREQDAARYLRKEGKKLQSWILTQLGSKIGSSNPAFEKVTRMIQGMIAKLEKEAAGEADQHAWCLSENKKTSASLQAKSDKLDEMKTRFEQATSNKQQLLDQVKQLQEELRQMDKSQKEATELRAKEHKAFLTAQKDLSNAQQACATAIKVLKEYYGGQASDSADAASLLQMDTSAEALASQPAGSAASSIIGMLEVAEADFSRNLAEATTTEDQQANEYEQSTDDNKVSKAAKDADIRNKESEIKRLKSLIDEVNMDVTDATSEKEAVAAYQQKLKKNCETKAPSYEERQKRRADEMDGLKNALDILNGNGIALLQQNSEQANVDELLSGFK